MKANLVAIFARNMTKELTIVLIGLAVALFPVNSSAAPSGPAIQELYKAAKAEGEVLLQLGSPVAQFKPVIDAFEKKYPGIKVSAFTLRGSDVPPRIIMESKAGKLSMDVAMGTIVYIAPLVERDLLVSYDWTKISDVDPKAIALQGRHIALYDQPCVTVYNTNLVSKKDLPRSFEEMLDPKWKNGKIAMTASESIWGQLFDVWKQDKPKFINFMQRLRDQKPFIASNNTATIERVASGECLLGITHAVLVTAPLSKGAPIGIAPITPTYNLAYGLYMPKGLPHPNAGKLMFAYLSSKEANPIWEKTGRARATPCDAGQLAKLMCASGVEHRNIDTIEATEEFKALGTKAMDVLGVVP